HLMVAGSEAQAIHEVVLIDAVVGLQTVAPGSRRAVGDEEPRVGGRQGADVWKRQVREDDGIAGGQGRAAAEGIELTVGVTGGAAEVEAGVVDQRGGNDVDAAGGIRGPSRLRDPQGSGVARAARSGSGRRIYKAEEDVRLAADVIVATDAVRIHRYDGREALGERTEQRIGARRERASAAAHSGERVGLQKGLHGG